MKEGEGRQPTAVGSVWNKDSWHWEEKNYTTKALKDLAESVTEWSPHLSTTDTPHLSTTDTPHLSTTDTPHLSTTDTPHLSTTDTPHLSTTDTPHLSTTDTPPQAGSPSAHPSHCQFKFTDVVSKGEVKVSVRRRRKIVAYDLVVSFDWEVVGDSPLRGCKGRVHLPDLSPDEVKDEDLVVNIITSESDESHKQCEEILKRTGIPAIRKHFKLWDGRIGVEEELLIDEDRQRREAELTAMKSANDSTGGMKALLLTEQKAKEEEVYRAKLNQDLRGVSSGDAPAPSPLVASPTDTQGGGSVWNAHSYHWEEKEMSRWACDTLGEKLKVTTIKLLNGACDTKLFDCKVTGEASATIRKGKKLTIFELCVRGSWTATRRDQSTGTFLADAKGSFDVIDFSSCSCQDDEYEVKIKCDDDKGARAPIASAMKTEGSQAIKNLLAEFVKEMGQKG